jgi:F0F1-type ATP synthase membrane subunit c/vacuolar-type H+-ATPase subunit K
MSAFASILHYTSIVSIICLNTISAGLGAGIASISALQAINIQPRAQDKITRALIIGLALIETSVILASIIAILLFRSHAPDTASGLAQLGIACAVGITGCAVATASSFPVKKACLSIARQPFFSQNVLNIMLITMSLIQTPIIFGFLIALFIQFQIGTFDDLSHGIRLLASGLALGIGSIGPTMSLARFAQQACYCVSINRNAYNKIMSFALMSEAIIETPIIFAFLVSLILVLFPSHQTSIVRMIAVALCIGIGTFTPSLGSSAVASSACLQIAYNPQESSILTQTSIFGQTLIDAAAIYALLISLLIYFMQ